MVTRMLRILFWLWRIHGIWVDCAHQTPCSCHGHLNICSAMTQRFVSQHRRNRWRRKSLDVKLVLWGVWSLTSQLQHRNQSRVQMSLWGPATSIFLDSSGSTWLAGSLLQMPSWSNLPPPGCRCMMTISFMLEYRPRWYGGTDVYMLLVNR